MKMLELAKRLAILLPPCLGLALASCQSMSYTYDEYHTDKAALDKAMETGTEDAFQAFIDERPHSPWKSHAVYHRDEAALREAERIGTKEAYKEFMRKYPWSKWRHVAEYSLLNEAA